MNRSGTRALVVLAASVAVVGTAAGSALAVAQARATGSQPIGPVAGFGAQASTSASSASQSGPLTLTFGTLDPDRSFFVRNTGGLRVAAQTWTVTVANTGGLVRGAIDVVVCSGAYSGTTCNGTETTVVAGVAEDTTATATTTYAIPVGGALSAKIVQSKKVSSFTVTIGLTVSRSQTTPAASNSNA